MISHHIERGFHPKMTWNNWVSLTYRESILENNSFRHLILHKRKWKPKWILSVWKLSVWDLLTSSLLHQVKTVLTQDSLCFLFNCVSLPLTLGNTAPLISPLPQHSLSFSVLICLFQWPWPLCSQADPDQQYLFFLATFSFVLSYFLLRISLFPVLLLSVSLSLWS